MPKRKMLLGAATLAILAASQPGAMAAPITPPVAGVTAPVDYFPQEPGSDYFLANYTQYEAYVRKLATESDRMKLVEIGRSAEGRMQVVAIVSTPANLAKLDRYKEIARRLAKAEGLTDADARSLAQEGKAVVWIDAGLHATETVTTQSQIHVLYRMLTGTDAETMNILENTIVLFGQDNPDGLQLVADWYMRNEDPKKREFRTIPRLYQKYVGHDNNRDSYMVQQAETINVNRMLFREWFPQIVYNMHQTGPAGMVVFMPPFRDPFNYNYDPLVMTELGEVGLAMHSRLVSEGKAGSGMRSAANYSTWHNGMERSVAYFHNSIGLLTEIIGGPTPEMIPLIPDVQLPSNDKPMPIEPREWHLKDSLEYTWSMNRAVMDYAARNRERLLFNIYRMGSNAIARGRTDSWTTTPQDIDKLKEEGKTRPAPQPGPNEYFRGAGRVDPKLFGSVLKDPAKRDPRGYILTANQTDMPTAIVFLNTLIKNGVDVMRATRPFTAGGKSYPAGSFVVRTDQAYRPHVLDMFEPQDHPHNLEYPGGPPIPPYDVTGYNLTYQMGFQYDRMLDAFSGPFEKVPDVLTSPPGRVVGSGRAGWLIRHDVNNSFTLTNRLLKAGAPVQWLTGATTAAGRGFAPGTVWVPASPGAAEIIQTGVQQLGIDAYAVGSRPRGATMALKPVRIGLVDQYGGVMPAGWTKWVLEQFEFPYTPVYPQELDAGNLNAKYDVLLFADGTVPGDGGVYRERSAGMPKPEDIPAEFRPWLGAISDAKTVPQLASFARNGGTILTIGSATRLATALSAPLAPALATTVDGKAAPLNPKDFYIPGAILQAKVDNTQPLAFGMPERADLFFAQSQTFNLSPGVGAVKRIAWFDSATPLRSGWAWHQERLNNTTAIADVDMGRGKLFVMGPEVAQRAQPYMTFKFLFNGLLYGPAIAATR